MEGIKFTKDEALLIEWCLEQMHSDLESSDDLIDVNGCFFLFTKGAKDLC